MKRLAILILLLGISSCIKDDVNPHFDTRILTRGSRCKISPDVIGQEGQPKGWCTVDSMDYHDSYYNNGIPYYYFVYVTQDDGRRDAIPDEDLVDCN